MSHRTIYVCDKCARETEERHVTPQATVSYRPTAASSMQTMIRVELCHDCGKLLNEALQSIIDKFGKKGG